MTTQSTQDLAAIGEALLELLAAQGGMIANPPRHDLEGWDSLLELPSEPTPPFDLSPGSPRAFVQVKTTTGDGRRASIKLSNWHRMVTDSAPWFVLGIHVDPDRTPGSAFLVHIGQEWMEKALKRLRQCEEAPHTVRMDVSWASEEKLSRVHGQELRAAIERHLGSEQASYERRKYELLKKLGYETGGTTLSVRLAPKPTSDQIAEWSELALGLRDGIPVEDATLVDVRFGIPAPAKALGAGTLRLQPHGKVGALRLIAADGRERLGAPAHLYATGGLPMIPSESDRARLRVGPFNLVMALGRPTSGDGPVTKSADIFWDDSSAFTIEDLGVGAAMHRVLGRAGTKAQVVPDITAPHKSVALTCGGFAMPRQRVEELRELEAASSVLKGLGLQGWVSCASAVGSGFPQFTMLDHLLSGVAPDVEVTVSSGWEGTYDTVVAIITPAVCIDDLVVVGIFALLSAPRIEGERALVRGVRVQTGALDVVPRAEIGTFDLTSRVVRFSGELEAEHGDGVLVIRSDDPKLMYFGSGPSSDAAGPA